MNFAILSDDQAAAEALRSALNECGMHCPIDRVFPIAASTSFLGTAPRDFHALFVIPSDNEASLVALADLCSRGSLPVIAVGAARDPRFMLRVIHAGPSNYLDIEGDLCGDLQRALARLQTAERDPSVDGKLISVFAHSGGCGCSLFAANLAVSLAAMREQCLLCDFNFRRGDLAALLNLKPTCSINDVVKNANRLQRDDFQRALSAHSSGVKLLAAPASYADVRPIPIDAVPPIIKLSRRNYPFTVVELEDFFHPEQFEMLRQSDVVLFVMRLDYTSLRNARRTFEYLSRDTDQPIECRVVVSQHGRQRELTTDQAEEVLGRPVNYLIPFEPKVAIESINRGVPVVQSSPRSLIARAVQKVATEIAGATCPAGA